LYRVDQNEIAGLNGFGDTGESEKMQQKAMRLKFPLSVDSIFMRIVTEKKTHCGKLPDTPVNREMVAGTGRLLPRAVALLPLLSAGQVVAILYGDNAVSRKPVPDLEGLEIFLAQAGLIIENLPEGLKTGKLHFQ
jgi:hypothetical protein